MEHYVITKSRPLYSVKDKAHAVVIHDLGFDTSLFVKKFGVDVSEFEKYIFSFNISAWRHFYDNSKEQYCLITEEGVDFREDFRKVSAILDEVEGTWDIFFPYDKIHFSDNNYPIAVSRFGFFWGTYCYFINRDSVKKLMDAFPSITGPLDEELLKKGIDKDIRCVCAETGWFSFDQSTSNSLRARKESVHEYIRNYRAWEDKEIIQVREILHYLSHAAEAVRVKIFLHAGTLLGAIRHGKIMDWDDDVDLMINGEDKDLLIDYIIRDGRYSVTPWVWKKTGKIYYKIWKPGGFKVECYDYTFPFVDVWLMDSDEKADSVETSDGYVFRYDTYYPLLATTFENTRFYLPQKSESILDTMYAGWREEIKIFSWSHKLKQHSIRQITAFIETDKNGRFVNYK